MKYNFDEIIDRRTHNSIKWTGAMEHGEDVLPMWIADMDFRVADEILEALKKPIKEGILGYNYRPDSFYEAIIAWVKEMYNWGLKREWLVFSPGVVPGLSIAIESLTYKGDGVLVQPPVYPPFYRVVNNLNRKAIENPMVWNGNRYTMDIEDLERKINKNTKLALFCNPHNPVGRVWEKGELETFGEICLKNNVIIVSDEIHSDFAFKGHKHIPLGSISNELAMNTITFMAPSKTFNIAGLYASVAIIPNDEIREKYIRYTEIRENIHANVFSVAGFEAAYKYGGQWLGELMEYIEANADFAVNHIKENIPEVLAYKPDGTFLMWIDFNNLGKSSDEINDLLISKGKVLLNNGALFGTGGEGFFRLNIGCPRKVLEDGLKRIERAIR